MKIAYEKTTLVARPYAPPVHPPESWNVIDVPFASLPKQPWAYIGGKVIHKVFRTVTKRQLVENLIRLGVEVKFMALLSQLPVAEKLRWEASPTVAENYPFLVAMRAMLMQQLELTDAQFDSIFDA
jgi:hypothetical protein